MFRTTQYQFYGKSFTPCFGLNQNVAIDVPAYYPPPSTWLALKKNLLSKSNLCPGLRLDRGNGEVWIYRAYNLSSLDPCAIRVQVEKSHRRVAYRTLRAREKLGLRHFVHNHKFPSTSEVTALDQRLAND